MDQSTQDLIDFYNGLLTQYDNQIASQQLTKDTIDQNITGMEQGIVQMENQKAGCDANIASYEQAKIFINETILILEALPSN